LNCRCLHSDEPNARLHCPSTVTPGSTITNFLMTTVGDDSDEPNARLHCPSTVTPGSTVTNLLVTTVGA